MLTYTIPLSIASRIVLVSPSPLLIFITISTSDPFHSSPRNESRPQQFHQTLRVQSYRGEDRDRLFVDKLDATLRRWA